MHSAPRAPRRGIAALGKTGDPAEVAALLQAKIARYAHAMLDRPLGHEQAAFIAVNVWIWFMERQAKVRTFLDSPQRFRRGIHTKLFDELRAALKELGRFDYSIDIDDLVAQDMDVSDRRPTRPDELFVQSETIWHVQRAIARLAPQTQRVIRLYDLEGWTADEVAIELGIAPGTVRQIRHRGKAKLRRILSASGYEKSA